MSAYYDGWNSTHLEIFNYFLFGLILVFLMYISRQFFKKNKSHIGTISILMLVTPLFWETHGWHQQNHIHITTLLSFLLVQLLFHSNLRSYIFPLTIILLFLLTGSWGKGIVSALTIVFFWVMMNLFLLRKNKISVTYFSKVIGVFFFACLFSLMARGYLILESLPRIDLLNKISDYNIYFKILYYKLQHYSWLSW